MGEDVEGDIMSNGLYSFDLTVSLSYYTYPLYSYIRQNEYVMGFEKGIEWDENYNVKDVVESDVDKNEALQFRIICNYEKDNGVVPEDHFTCEIKNIVAESEGKAYKFIHPRLYKICRTLSIIMNMYNQHKSDFQPRVEVDLSSLSWRRHEYCVNNTEHNMKLPSGEIVNVTYIKCCPITKVFTKGICDISLDKFNDFFNNTDSELNYILDEFYFALGKEDVHSKFFHLFSIIEFIEKQYKKLSGATALLTEDEVRKIVEHISDIEINLNPKIMQRVTDTLKSSLPQMTDYGRNIKLANILNNMGIKEIKCMNKVIMIDKKVVAQMTKLRNCLFHGDSGKSREDADKEIQIVVEELLIICEMIIEWVVDPINKGASD